MKRPKKLLTRGLITGLFGAGAVALWGGMCGERIRCYGTANSSELQRGRRSPADRGRIRTKSQRA